MGAPTSVPRGRVRARWRASGHRWGWKTAAGSAARWDDDEVSRITSELFDELKELEDMKEILCKAKESEQLQLFLSIIGNDDPSVFRMLFKFELFDLHHRCISDAKRSGKIEMENKTALLNNL